MKWLYIFQFRMNGNDSKFSNMEYRTLLYFPSNIEILDVEIPSLSKGHIDILSGNFLKKFYEYSMLVNTISIRFLSKCLTTRNGYR